MNRQKSICNVPPREPGILELQGWTDWMDSYLGPSLNLFFGVMTLIRDLLEDFICYKEVMACLIVYAIKTIMQIVYITGMWSVLANGNSLNTLHSVEESICHDRRLLD